MLRSLAVPTCAVLSLAACADDDPAPLADVSVMSDRAVFGDAALSPDGTVGFFAGMDASTPVVARLATDGAPVELVRGAPLVSARGLVAIDATTVLVADEDGDAVVRVGAGAPAPVAGTVGTRPRAVELDGAGALYWVGDDGDGAAVFTSAAGVRRVIARDARFTTLDGLDVAADGTVYVTDRAGAVYRIAGGEVTALAEGVRLGSPAGVALAPDDATLLVSSLDADHHSQVLLVDVATGAQATFHDVIDVNTAAGGLHRAQDAAREFIWAGVTSGADGTVFRVTLR